MYSCEAVLKSFTIAFWKRSSFSRIMRAMRSSWSTRHSWVRVTPVANRAFCASKIFWNLFIGLSGLRLQRARLNGVDGGVVPVTIQARDFAAGVEANDVSVGYASDLTFLYKAWDVRWHSPAEQCLHHDGVLFGLDHLDNFHPEIRYGLRKAPPDLFKPAADRHDTVLAIGEVPPLCIVSAKSEHAFDVMSAVGGEKFLGDRLHIFVFIHIASPLIENMRC